MALWSSNASFEKKAQALIPKFIRDLGIGPMDAAAIVGNLAHESGEFRQLQEINPTIEGSRGGYGWAQWTGPRRRQFERWAAERSLTLNSHEANYGFLIHELKDTWEKKAIPAIKGEATLEDKTIRFMREFERPGIEHRDRRIDLARKAYAAYVTDNRPTEGEPAPTVNPAVAAAAGGAGVLAVAAQTTSDVIWWIGVAATIAAFIWLLAKLGVWRKLWNRIMKKGK